MLILKGHVHSVVRMCRRGPPDVNIVQILSALYRVNAENASRQLQASCLIVRLQHTWFITTLIDTPTQG